MCTGDAATAALPEPQANVGGDGEFAEKCAAACAYALARYEDARAKAKPDEEAADDDPAALHPHVEDVLRNNAAVHAFLVCAGPNRTLGWKAYTLATGDGMFNALQAIVDEDLALVCVLCGTPPRELRGRANAAGRPVVQVLAPGEAATYVLAPEAPVRAVLDASGRPYLVDCRNLELFDVDEAEEVYAALRREHEATARANAEAQAKAEDRARKAKAARAEEQERWRRSNPREARRMGSQDITSITARVLDPTEDGRVPVDRRRTCFPEMYGYDDDADSD